MPRSMASFFMSAVALNRQPWQYFSPYRSHDYGESTKYQPKLATAKLKFGLSLLARHHKKIATIKDMVANCYYLIWFYTFSC